MTHLHNSKYETRSIPVRAGIGLRSIHYREVIDDKPAIAWVEIHSENFFADGGKPHDILEEVRQSYPISMHGVGLSLGSVDPLNQWHLDKLKMLNERYQPGLISEHLCWNSIDQRYLNDLLPLPYTQEAINHIVPRIQQVQEYIGRQILIENLSSYLQFNESCMPEWDFVSEVARRSGCGILLDINNIYVNASNHHFDPDTYLKAIPVELVGEMHLAGHIRENGYLLDTHSAPVCDAVWQLYRRAVARFGPTPTLIEWDCDIPPLPRLLQEAAKAQHILDGHYANVA
ncbi:MAG: DUF692 domain-containing protein [Gammaproteobacteria bacterium]